MSTVATVEEYLALPRAERAEAYNTLPEELKREARRASEARRGIAFRTQDSEIIFSRDALKAQIVRLATKKKELAVREIALQEKVIALKRQAQNMYGEDFLAEVETALEA